MRIVGHAEAQREDEPFVIEQQRAARARVGTQRDVKRRDHRLMSGAHPELSSRPSILMKARRSSRRCGIHGGIALADVSCTRLGTCLSRPAAGDDWLGALAEVGGASVGGLAMKGPAAGATVVPPAAARAARHMPRGRLDRPAATASVPVPRRAAQMSPALTPMCSGELGSRQDGCDIRRRRRATSARSRPRAASHAECSRRRPASRR